MKIYNTTAEQVVEMHLNNHVSGQEDELRQIIANYDYLNGSVTVSSRTDADFEADAETIEQIEQLIAVDGDGEKLGWN